MGFDETSPTERAIIVLQGGGRLEQVAEILDVRLEADPLQCIPEGPDRIAVKGGVRAYVYCRSARGRDVAGQGFYIPFSSRINPGSIPVRHADAALGELRSDHRFNPITGEFEHQITVEIVVLDRRTGGPQGKEERLPQAPRSESASGEVRLSQVRTGSLSERPNESGAVEPVSSREPTPEEYHNLYGSSAGAEKTKEREEPAPPSGAPKVEEPQTPTEKKEGPIVWGPFPPPIN